MRIGYIESTERFQCDSILTQFADTLLSRKFNVCGAVQSNEITNADCKCDMDIRVLPNGLTIRISQSLGRHAGGCRLDTGALENAVAQTESQLSADCDILIINKFGKHEAAGRGFRELIGTALVMDIPVLVGLSTENTDAFLHFTGGLASKVPASISEMDAWFQLDRSTRLQVA